MNPNQAQLLKEVIAADFTLIDLNLYLNTHPYDQNAIMLFTTVPKEQKYSETNTRDCMAANRPKYPLQMPVAVDKQPMAVGIALSC